MGSEHALAGTLLTRQAGKMTQDAAAGCCCPCCGNLTLGARKEYEICPVCFWEDDGQDDESADEVWGGPNGALSLTEARRNYMCIGAADPNNLRLVRPPTAAESAREAALASNPPPKVAPEK